MTVYDDNFSENNCNFRLKTCMTKCGCFVLLSYPGMIMVELVILDKASNFKLMPILPAEAGEGQAGWVGEQAGQGAVTCRGFV